MRSLKKILVFLRSSYTLDLRALGLMRMGLALVIMADLLIRGTDLKAFFTDEGIWPGEMIRTFGWKSGYWCFHDLSGNSDFQLALFAFHFLLALLLLLGFRTRIVTLLLFVFTVSLHNRNLFIQQSGDDLLRMVLLWGIFLPWGARYSIEKAAEIKTKRQPALANLGYLLLIGSVYLFSALLKSSPEWHREGLAVYYALSLEQLRLPTGDFLYWHPTALKLITWIVYYLELLIPLLILWPTKKQVPRLFAFLFIMLLHLGIGLSLYVGLFYIIGITTALGLLPKIFMDRVETRFSRNRTVVLRKLTAAQLGIFNVICLLILFFSLTINLSSLPFFTYQLREEVLMFPNALRLDQYWGMFSPSVLKKDGWFVYHGNDSVGRQWDLRLNQDYVDYKKPSRIVNMYRSDRWRKLAENLQDDRFTFLRPPYCSFVLRTWNRSHPRKKINILNLYFMEKTNLPFYKKPEVTKKLFCVCTEK